MRGTRHVQRSRSTATRSRAFSAEQPCGRGNDSHFGGPAADHIGGYFSPLQPVIRTSVFPRSPSKARMRPVLLRRRVPDLTLRDRGQRLRGPSYSVHEDRPMITISTQKRAPDLRILRAALGNRTPDLRITRSPVSRHEHTTCPDRSTDTPE
jgi:hypothetical protein